MRCLLLVLQKPGPLINYRHLFQLIRNVIKREQVLEESQRFGLDYRIVTKSTLDFFIRLQQVASDGLLLTQPLKPYLKTLVINGAELQVMNYDDFMDQLFMKFRVQCPPAKSQEELKLLLTIEVQNLVFVVIPKVARILHDLPSILPHLTRLINSPDAVKNQNAAKQILQARQR